MTGLPRNVDLDYAVEALKPILVPAPTIVGGHELRSQCKGDGGEIGDRVMM